MANPVPVSYSSPVQKVGGGREVFPNASLDLIAAAPENSWIKLNANTYQSVWSPADSRNSNPPARILGAWGSAGWDEKRSRFVVWGGGHANTSSNEVYIWSAYTRSWSHAFFDTQIHVVDSYPTYRSVDGNASPVSSHTYCGNIYLPVIDRFYTGGGAAAGTGGPLSVWDGNTKLRYAGGYTLDLALAGQGFVAGLPGSNRKVGSFAAKELPGARAWKLRDWFDGRNATLAAQVGDRIESGAVATVEDGRDVIYTAISSRMWRIEIVDDNQENDIVTRVAGYQNERRTNGAMALDPVRRVIYMPAGESNPSVRKGYFVDLKIAPIPSTWGLVVQFDNEIESEFLSADGHSKSCGLVYYPPQGCFVQWSFGRQPWFIFPPDGSPTPSTGWRVEKPEMDMETDAPGNPDAAVPGAGAMGKFRYAPDLGCCVAIQNQTLGDVWALKLAGWTDPRTA